MTDQLRSEACIHGVIVGRCVECELVAATSDRAALLKRVEEAEGKLCRVDDWCNNHGFDKPTNMSVVQPMIRSLISSATCPHKEEAERLREEANDINRALDAISAPTENDGIAGKVSAWRRIELVGKLLWRYREQHEADLRLRAEGRGR